MTVSLGRIRKYSLVPYLDRCPEEFHGTDGYYKVFETIFLIFKLKCMIFIKIYFIK